MKNALSGSYFSTNVLFGHEMFLGLWLVVTVGAAGCLVWASRRRGVACWGGMTLALPVLLFCCVMF